MSSVNKQKYKSGQCISQIYGISTSTLRNWANKDKIRCVRIQNNGKRFYDISDVERELGAVSTGDKEKKCVCYGRVSSAHQKTSLERQVADLRAAYPSYDIITDIGSGINWNRKGFHTILEYALQGTLGEVVVTNRDRLCRFAYPLVQHVFEHGGARIVVLDQPDEASADGANSADASGFNELAEDLLAITTIFTARYHGRRSGAKRKRSNRAACETHTALSNKRAKRNTARVVRSGTLGLQQLCPSRTRRRRSGEPDTVAQAFCQQSCN